MVKPIPDNAKFAIDQAKRSDLNRRLARSAQQFDAFITVIEQAAAKHPEIKEDAFRAIAEEYQKERAAFLEEASALHMASPDTRYTNVEINKLRQKYHDKIHDRVFKEHGRQGTAAWQAVAQELQGESIFTSMTKMVYNTENGGMQWGGLIGLIAGGIGGYMLTSGSGMIINILGTLAIAGIAAYAGHKMIDSEPKPLATPDFHTAKKSEKGKNTGPVVQVDKDRGPDVKREADTFAVHHHNPADDFQVPGGPKQPDKKLDNLKTSPITI